MRAHIACACVCVFVCLGVCACCICICVCLSVCVYSVFVNTAFVGKDVKTCEFFTLAFNHVFGVAVVV